MILRKGKADENVLDRSVRKRLGHSLSQQKEMGVSSDPVTLRTRHVGMLAVTAAANDLAAQGIRPDCVRTDILLPPGTEESALRGIEDEIRETSLRADMTVTGGHTEVTSAVSRPIVIAHAAGTKSLLCGSRSEPLPGDAADTAGAAESEGDRPAEADGRPGLPAPGDSILAIGRIGLEGTFLLAQERSEELERRFGVRFVRRAQQAGEHLLILPSVQAMSELGVCPAHLVNVSEGGIYAAIWRLSTETGWGLEVSLPDIPILQETIEITNYYDINPYQMESAGCVLAVIPAGRAGICEQMEGRGFVTRIIGSLTEGRDKVIAIGEERQSLNRPAADALIPILG